MFVLDPSEIAEASRKASCHDTVSEGENGDKSPMRGEVIATGQQLARGRVTGTADTTKSPSVHHGITAPSGATGLRIVIPAPSLISSNRL